MASTACAYLFYHSCFFLFHFNIQFPQKFIFMTIFFYEFSVYFVEFDIFLLLYSFAAFEQVDFKALFFIKTVYEPARGCNTQVVWFKCDCCSSDGPSAKLAPWFPICRKKKKKDSTISSMCLVDIQICECRVAFDPVKPSLHTTVFQLFVDIDYNLCNHRKKKKSWAFQNRNC